MIRTRIAPSPTGQDLHIGNLYTALINWVFARQNHGHFIVRIEDTDQTRLVQGSESKILQTLNDFGLKPDESPQHPGPYGPYRQSERLPIYRKISQQLVEKGKAYYCFCSRERLEKLKKEAALQKKQSKYDRHCLNLNTQQIQTKLKENKPYVIRLKIPEGQTIFQDLIRGDITIANHILDDQILIKSDGFPTYHLAVVVDDYLMRISHVIRAEEWISSTPKHIIIYQALGWPLPKFIHLPILRNPDRSKLSKRKNPVWASWYLEQGFLPEALLNYLALMGWSHPQSKEIFSLTELIKHFNFSRVDSGGPIFDFIKLKWINGEYIRKSKKSEIKSQVLKYTEKYQKLELDPKIVDQTIALVQTRMKQLNEYWPLVSFIFKQPDKINYPLNFFKQVKKDLLNKYEQTSWQHLQIYQITEKVALNNQIKPIKLFMDIRYALSNQKVTAPLFEAMEIIGQQKTITRLNKIE